MTGAMPIDASREGIITSGKSLSAAVSGASLSLTILSFLIGIFATTGHLDVSPALPFLITAVSLAFTVGSGIYYVLTPTTEESIETQLPRKFREILKQ